MTAVLIIAIVLASLGWLIQLAMTCDRHQEQVISGIMVLILTAAIVAMSLALGLGV